MRSINPFSYFVDHASQLRGFGGERPSPDPQYCFHTRYEVVRPGRAIFSMKLLGARATQGEITVRIHAFRPEAGGSPSLTAGARLDLSSNGNPETAVAIPFHAINGVEYALYGFFSEPTDLSVDAVEILLEEPIKDTEIVIEPPRSALAQTVSEAQAGPATGLAYHDAVDRDRPVSQDCTWRQLEPDGSFGARLSRWRETVCHAAIAAYDVELPGIDCWVAGPASAFFVDAVQAKRFALSSRDQPPPNEHGDFADVLLWPEGPVSSGDRAARWAAVQAWLERLKVGGLAAVGIRYSPDPGDVSTVTRNEIQQWALRLVGLGYSIAPFAFADRAELAVDETGAASCCLIVRRQ